jgi:hypothetical protein
LKQIFLVFLNHQKNFPLLLTTLPAGEDIGTNQVNLGVTMLTSLGGGHFNNLTRSTLDDDVAVLSQGRTLHGESERGTGISGFEGLLVIVRHTIKSIGLIYTSLTKKHHDNITKNLLKI